MDGQLRKVGPLKRVLHALEETTNHVSVLAIPLLLNEVRDLSPLAREQWTEDRANGSSSNRWRVGQFGIETSQDQNFIQVVRTEGVAISFSIDQSRK